MDHPKKVRQEAGGVVLWEGQVVLHRTGKGNLNFPKGRIEPGETPEQAAVREVLEETGLVAETVAALGTLALLHIPKPQEVQFFLMRATAAPGWDQHDGCDAELAPVESVVGRLTFKEYRRFWRGISERVARYASKPPQPDEVGRGHPNPRPSNAGGL
jgi:8-oxo-dGTP pyrophosphatase MutT (NUDIX family)